MIKQIANPFFVAFTLPFVLVLVLLMIQFQLPDYPLTFFNKTIVIAAGSARLDFFAEGLYVALDSIPVIGDTLKAAWIQQYVKEPLIKAVFETYVSLNFAMIAGGLFWLKRWITTYYSRQYEKQSLLTDKKFIK